MLIGPELDHKESEEAGFPSSQTSLMETKLNPIHYPEFNDNFLTIKYALA